MKTTGAFAALKITHNAMLAGQILFVAVLFYLGYTREKLPTLSNLDKILQAAAIALAAMAFFFGGTFFKKKLADIKRNEKAGTKEKLDKYKTASIVQWAMLEGACLFCGVSFFITGNYAFLALALVLMLIFGMLAPIKSKIAFQLGLGISDIEEL
jgi:uncharacterized membrane protein YbhN (UPF0104 family)